MERTSIVRVNFKRLQDFNDGSWTKFNSPTITVNDSVAPDGTTTADLLTDPYSGFNARIEDTITVSDDSDNYCASLFIKKEASEAYSVIQLQFQGGTAINYSIRIRKDTGDFTDEGTAFSGAGADAIDLGVEDYGDYWRLFIVGANNGTGNTTALFRIFIAVTSGNGTTTGSATVWGAQFEEQSQPTSYIATSGSTATRSADVYTTATKERSADVCYIDGTAFTDLGSAGGQENYFIHIDDGTYNNRIEFDRLVATDNIRFRITQNGTSYTENTSGTYADGSDVKVVFAFIDSSFRGYINGSDVAENTSIIMPSGLNKFSIGYNGPNNTGNFNGSFRKIIYFPRKLTPDTQLAKLTQ